MGEPKKVLYILCAIIAFIITVAVYLFVKQHYILATSIMLLCGLWVFFSIQGAVALIIQQEILDYLGKDNNMATVVEIINHLHYSSKRCNKTVSIDLVLYSIEKLILKNMVVIDQGRIRRVT